MCWVLYLAADRPLPLRPFQPDSPGFNVSVPTGREIAVRRQFGRPFVYALGSHTGCGCGFDRAQTNPDHPEELPATERSLAELRAYLGGPSTRRGRSSSSPAGTAIRTPCRITAGSGRSPTSPRR